MIVVSATIFGVIFFLYVKKKLKEQLNFYLSINNKKLKSCTLEGQENKYLNLNFVMVKTLEQRNFPLPVITVFYLNTPQSINIWGLFFMKT